MVRRMLAEGLGTLWLVFCGCGSAVLAANFGDGANPLGIGFAGVAAAFGLSVLTGIYAFGHVSGGHFNPAVSIGLWAGGRFPVRDLVPYVLAQLLGAILAGFILTCIVKGQAGYETAHGVPGAFATNGYGELSPGGYSMGAAFLIETLLTAVFLLVILGATRKDAPSGFAPIAIGLALVAIHLISIPVTNTSVNPARSTGVALFVDSGPIRQLWLFWLAPILGAMTAGVAYRWLDAAARNRVS